MNYSVAEAPSSLPDDEAMIEAVIALVPRIGQRLHASTAAHAQAWGLTVGQAKVLLKVGLCGPTPVGEIAAALAVSMPAASEIVDRLVESGFVRRTDDPADRRRVLVAPSAAAERFAVGLKRQRVNQVRRALDALAPDQRPVLVQGLEALLDALGDSDGSDAIAGPSVETGPCPALQAEESPAVSPITAGSNTS